MSKDKGVGKGEGKQRRRRPKDRHFMDAALDAFIRDSALRLWRDFIVYRDRQGKAPAEALRETGFFQDKGDFTELWTDQWERTAVPAADLDDGEIFGHIEAAVRIAVLEEKAARQQRGGESLEDTEEYNTFVRQTLNQLLTEASAENEI
jgi:hypothetical protein